MSHTRANNERITEATCTQLTGRDGQPQRVWKNPGHGEFAKVVASADQYIGMRCLLTARDLYFWQSTVLLHSDFTEQTGIDGVKINLRRDGILANLDTIGAPEEFPWIFAGVDVAKLDMERRGEIVVQWLRENSHLQRVYGANFKIEWYT